MTLEPSGADELLLADTLELLRPDIAVHPENYRDCVILKPWGMEFELFDDKKHAVWMLNIRPNRSTSLHCHQHKAVCLVPLVGEITVITLSDQIAVKPGETI